MRMQELIRNLPAVVYEYAFFPDGSQGFRYVSEKSLAVCGLDPAVLSKGPDALYAICLPEDLAHLALAFTREPLPVASRRHAARVWVDGVVKGIELVYNDEVLRDGTMVRRGFVQEVPPGELFPSVDHDAYEELLEKLPIGVVIHSNGVIVFANTHAHRIVGAARPRQLIGLRAFDFVHPDYVADILSRIKEVAAGKSVPMAEEKFIKLDGTLIDVETMAFPFTYKGDRAVQVIFRDITEKKNTEAQIRKNETLFTRLFESIPIALVMLDETGKVAEINPGFEKMFGYGREALHGRNLNDFIVPENLRNEGIDLNNLIASNKVVGVESIRKHQSGRMINVILYGVPVMQDHQVIGIYGVYVDITDRKKVEEELKVRNTELDNFVYKISHDLRAPLSSVLGLVNLSRVKGNDDNPQDYMDLIGLKIRALDNFIGDVLSHSKNLKMDVEIGRVDLQAIIERTFADLGYLEGTRRARKSVKIDGVDFYSDQWRIREIFRNLVSNAIKYQKTDSGDAEISISVSVDHLCANIYFADNGIGIKESSLKRIFDMFYRATDQSEGSGIGLYIVKNAVEKLGGQIKVASTLGEGTRFHILLPNRINSAVVTPHTQVEKA